MLIIIEKLLLVTMSVLDIYLYAWCNALRWRSLAHSLIDEEAFTKYDVSMGAYKVKKIPLSSKSIWSRKTFMLIIIDKLCLVAVSVLDIGKFIISLAKEKDEHNYLYACCITLCWRSVNHSRIQIKCGIARSIKLALLKKLQL